MKFRAFGKREAPSRGLCTKCNDTEVRMLSLRFLNCAKRNIYTLGMSRGVH